MVYTVISIQIPSLLLRKPYLHENTTTPYSRYLTLATTSISRGKVRCVKRSFQSDVSDSCMHDTDLYYVVIEARFRGLLDEDLENLINSEEV